MISLNVDISPNSSLNLTYQHVHIIYNYVRLSVGCENDHLNSQFMCVGVFFDSLLDQS